MWFFLLCALLGAPVVRVAKCHGPSEDALAVKVGGSLVLLYDKTADFYAAREHCGMKGMELARLRTPDLVALFEAFRDAFWVSQYAAEMEYTKARCQPVGFNEALVLHAGGCQSRNRNAAHRFACTCSYK